MSILGFCCVFKKAANTLKSDSKAVRILCFSAEIPNDVNIVRSSFHSDFDYAQDDTAEAGKIENFIVFYPSQSAIADSSPKGRALKCITSCRGGEN